MTHASPRPLGYAFVLHHPLRQRQSDRLDSVDMETLRRRLKCPRFPRKHGAQFTADRGIMGNDETLPVINNARLSPLVRPISLTIGGQNARQEISMFYHPSSHCARLATVSNAKLRQFCDVMGPHACRDCMKIKNRTNNTEQHVTTFPDLTTDQRLCGHHRLQTLSAGSTIKRGLDANDAHRTDSSASSRVESPFRNLVTCTEIQLRAMEKTRRSRSAEPTSKVKPKLLTYRPVITAGRKDSIIAPPMVATAFRRLIT